ncbi:MAG: PASTA domain-containing protein [Clostridiales bacterium]|nr:PASTA domain-containing protein [Clostridiales bacterium]
MSEQGRKNTALAGTMQRRMMFLLALLVGVCFLAILARLFQVQILQHDYYQAKAIDQQVRDTTVAPRRGTIYDRNNIVLAMSASTETVYIAPKSIRNQEEAALIARELSRILGVSEETILKKTAANNYYEIVKRQVTKELADEVRLLKKEHNLAALALAEDSKRYYPYGSFASHIIGFTNIDGKGIEGIESYYDDVLVGMPGRIISAKNAKGTDMPFRYEQMISAQHGYNLVLTLDEAVQHFIEKHLENAVTEYNVQNRATAIVMDVNTGAILAMATKPDFDLNDPRVIKDEALLAELAQLEGEEYDKRQMEIWQSMWRNKPIVDTYEPGSVFKIVTTSIALEQGVVNPHETFYCPGYKIVAGRRISCWKAGGHGSQDLLKGLQNSCNPVFMELGARIGGAAFYQYAEALGLRHKTGIDLYGEAAGIFHRQDVISKGQVEVAVTAFGQTFKVTPIQMITAISACVNGGKLMQPYLVSKIVDDEGNVIKDFEPVVKRQVISEETSNKVASMLEAVVANGTGRNAYIKGYRIGGKTGTSEKIDEKNEQGVADKRISSFCGFAPADNPQIAILMILDEPQVGQVTGGLIAAPVVRKMFEDILPYLGLMPQYTEEELASLEKSVPDVTALPVEKARATLREAGFTPQVVGQGTEVLEQVPRAALKLAKGGKVLLYTELEETSYSAEVPDVRGLSAEAAGEKLSRAGFNLRATGKDITEQNVTAGMQFPAAGDMAVVGSVVEVEFIHEAESEWVAVSGVENAG